MLKTKAIKAFLDRKAPPHLSKLYHEGMECQVNVSADGGELIEGEYHGIKWRGYQDDSGNIWKNFRIPWKAMSDPEYNDSPIKFDLESHVEGIGMTGWNWKQKRSKWLAFDFDAIMGHSDAHQKKLTQEELDEIKDLASQIPWVTVMTSTSGSGLHLYIYLEDDSSIIVNNHNEHAAIARAVMGQMSGITGCNFSTKVDVCGSNMWVWARKYERGIDDDGKHLGFKVLKEGRRIKDSEIPANWADHMSVIKGKRSRSIPKHITNKNKGDEFSDLCSQRKRVKLDDEHKALMHFLDTIPNHTWWFDQDSFCVTTHAYALKLAFDELHLRGAYDTISQGSNLGEQNCYLFPIRKGGWIVRRFTPGVSEHPLWDQDSAGWTRTFLNKDVDLALAARANEGIEDEKGWYHFSEAENAEKAALLLGTSLQLDPKMATRNCRLKAHKDGRLLVEMDRDDRDLPNQALGFLPDKKVWKRVVNVTVVHAEEADSESYDDQIRHVVSSANADYGWVIRTEENWIKEPLTHVQAVLGNLGFTPKDTKSIVGGAISRPWRLVNKPFQGEYPGDREWNKNAAQLKYAPSEVDNPKHPTWDKIYNHVGEGLDEFIKKNSWCRKAGILTGGDYLRAWASCVLKYPEQPLPYLFLYSRAQNTGKTTYHETLASLMTRGYADASAAVTSSGDYNGELEGAVLCSLEEIDLGKNMRAYNKIKNWVTGKEMLIHPKGETPYMAINTTHWAQCANDLSYCPIFKGDTRITLVQVEPILPMNMVPRMKLDELLEKEASEFVATLLRMELPPANDRLRIPVIDTDDKKIAEGLSLSQVQQYIKENCSDIPGAMIPFSKLYEKFIQYVGAKEAVHWSKIRLGKEVVQEGFPKGRLHGDGGWHFGNLCFKDDEMLQDKMPKLIQKEEYLEPENG